MKFYNYELAKTIIQTFIDLDVLDSATLGLHEDWFWTAGTIFEEGKWVMELCSNKDLEYAYEHRESPFEKVHPLLDKLIGGLGGSIWATPVLLINFTDGTDKTFECYYEKGEQLSPEELMKRLENVSAGLGCLSGPQFEERMKINLEKFIVPEENSK